MPFFISLFVILFTLVIKNSIAADGRINAMLYLPIPESETISIQILDNSDENLNIKKEFEQMFEKNGKKISANGRLVITIDRTSSQGAWTGVGANRLIQLRNREDHSGVKSPDIRLSLFDSDRGGLFNRGTTSKVTQVASSQYELTLYLDDRDNGRRLWQGWASVEVGKNDDETLLLSMVPVLIENFGKTVRSQSFSVN